MRLRDLLLTCAAASGLLTGCDGYEPDDPDIGQLPDLSGPGLIITCEGNFQYGNASLSFYDPASERVENELFYRVNGMRLGDVAQSAVAAAGRIWIVVNNSHAVFAVDPDTFRETGRITGLPSPRYIHFAGPDKAYITQLWDNKIVIADPTRYAVTGYIEVPGMGQESGSTEQMVQLGQYVYCNCWSYQNRIIRIDTATDRVDSSLTVGIQPESLALDRYGKLWTVTDGGYPGSPYGFEPPALLRIDAATFTIERRWQLPEGDSPRRITLNAAADTVYWINGGVWRMPVTASSLPERPFISPRDTHYFGLTVAPATGDVYVADAIDYQQPGIVYRYSAAGDLTGSFYTGVNPGNFCWKP